VQRAIDAAHGVSELDRAVFQQIASYAFSEAVCWPSQQTIADDLGLPAKSGRQQVSRSVGRLENAGWLNKSARLRGRYGWTFLVYELLAPWKPVAEWVRDHIVSRAEKRSATAVRTNSRGTSAKLRADWVPPTLRDVMRAIAASAQGASP
jgi:hypothetical protein